MAPGCQSGVEGVGAARAGGVVAIVGAWSGDEQAQVAVVLQALHLRPGEALMRASDGRGNHIFCVVERSWATHVDRSWGTANARQPLRIEFSKVCIPSTGQRDEGELSVKC